jgi:hypothetical protein
VKEYSDLRRLQCFTAIESVVTRVAGRKDPVAFARMCQRANL